MYRLKISTLFVYLLITLISFSCSTTDTKNKSASEAIAHFYKSSKVPGIVAAVGYKGNVIWSNAAGFADLEQLVPADAAQTKFRIGSVSKPFTATALGLLLQDGKIDLDVPIQNYVPGFPQKRSPISTHQVAGHLAGIRHYRNQEFLSAKKYNTVTEGLTMFQDDTLLFEPGTKYSYSSYGWNLVSAIVEGASGENFLPFMKSNVFQKMDMQSTVADHIDSLIMFRSRYYELHDDSIFVNAPFVDNSYKWAGGGFLSTAHDIVKFGFAHLYHKILNEETVELFWKTQQTADGKETNYGIGWASGKDDDGREWVGHNGGSIGGSTYFRIYPQSEVVVVVISNMSGARFNELPDQLADIFISDSNK